jgi:hypothetical protein
LQKEFKHFLALAQFIFEQFTGPDLGGKLPPSASGKNRKSDGQYEHENDDFIIFKIISPPLSGISDREFSKIKNQREWMLRYEPIRQVCQQKRAYNFQSL